MLGPALFFVLLAQSSFAAMKPAAPFTSTQVPASRAASPRGTQLASHLEGIREKVILLQQDLLESLKTQKQAQANLKKIRILMKLQQEEREVGMKRVAELEATVKELEARRISLREKISESQKEIHKTLLVLGHGLIEDPSQKTNPLGAHARERLEAPRRRVLANLTSQGLKEIEIMKADLEDADHLEHRIEDEKQQLTYLFQDLNEKESVLELNRQLQVDILKQKIDERVAQLENYRKLKRSEAQVEELIHDFNARLELERTAENERAISRAMAHGVFADLKGRLPLPLSSGKILSTYGRAYDPKSKLYVFKKGIDISAAPRTPVLAVSPGKVAYSGTLPNYGQVTIVDHGEHYYSLCAHLGSLSKKAGEPVKAGEELGETDDSGTPVYFEIRARNVAVNPLQWFSN